MDINGKSYELKYSLRSMFAWEEMTGKPFDIKTLLDTYCFCYACIIANEGNPSLEFNEFLDWCETHPEVMDEFHKFMDSELKKREVLGKGKKKVTRKEKN